MLKIFYTILYLLKQSLFGNKSDYNMRHPDFNGRKLTTFLIMIFLLIFNFLLAKRVAVLENDLHIAKKYHLESCKS